MNLPGLLNTLSTRARSVPIVILYVTAGCNLRCITCSYRDPLPNELTLKEYRDLAHELRNLGLRHVVYSGGEPLVRGDFPEICAIFQRIGVRQSMLTNGLLLEKRLDEILRFFEEIIVSIDGPDRLVHNAIRGLDSFDQIVKGMKKLLHHRTRPKLSVRMVIQRRNFRSVEQMINFGKDIGIDRISFLTADVLSQAFHRNHKGPMAGNNEILLTIEEAKEFRSIVRRLITEHVSDFQRGYISETPSKMMHLVKYFEAFHGLSPFPRNFCNAPMTSTVITSTGELLPCYFLPAYGDLRSAGIKDQLNSEQIRFTRKQVRSYTLEQCQRCVCTLKISPKAALLDRF